MARKLLVLVLLVVLSIGAFAATPTGSVNIYYNGNVLLATCPLDSSGNFSCSASTIPLGTYAVTAVYSSDSNFAASTIRWCSRAQPTRR